MLVGSLGSWYNANTLVFDLAMTSAIAAMSYQIALRSGVYAFISAGFWGVGAYAAGDIVTKTQLPWPVGILIGMAISALAGLVLSLLLFRLDGLYLGMATFAFDLVVGVAAAHAGSITGGAGGLSPIPQKISVPLLLGIFAVVCLLMSRLEVGRLGRAQELIHFNRELATALGVRLTAWRRWIFVLSAVVGSLAGSLYALTFYAVDPTQIGFSIIITGLAIVVVGGIATWRGCVIGAVIVVGVPNLFQSLQIWEPVIYGLLLLFVAVFMPEGIFGLWRRAVDAFASRGDRAGGEPRRGRGPLSAVAGSGAGDPMGRWPDMDGGPRGDDKSG
jgi:branched-chain amino acid transport system permease protein